MSKEPGQIERRIKEYLAGGGLYNPELMPHDKVRDLLIDCRDALAAIRADERAKKCDHLNVMNAALRDIEQLKVVPDGTSNCATLMLAVRKARLALAKTFALALTSTPSAPR